MFGVAMKIPGFYYNRMKMHPNKISTTSPPTLCELGLYIGDGGTQAMSTYGSYRMHPPAPSYKNETATETCSGLKCREKTTAAPTASYVPPAFAEKETVANDGEDVSFSSTAQIAPYVSPSGPFSKLARKQDRPEAAMKRRHDPSGQGNHCGGGTKIISSVICLVYSRQWNS
ncbi:hypothetical protein DY000_02013348 [Brassica cretica]|uniref:AT-hook motif nuclear-localized protein n=3 Tax=Brassica TaxID=3705 RepID=A0ABQ7DCX1_BRACR|nr:hypothetical protein DY000_02013348 [Brassica cretica]